MANDNKQQTQAADQAPPAPAADLVDVLITHGRYVYKAPPQKHDDKGEPMFDDFGGAVPLIKRGDKFGHDAAAVAGTPSARIKLPREEAELLVKGGTAKIVDARAA